MSRPLVLAHRGGAWDVPDSCLAAFRRAARLPIDGVELDVQVTADGKLVVAHDAHLAGRAIESLTLDEIRAIQGGGTPADLVVPTFEDVLKELPRHFHLNIELKAPRAVHPLVAAVQTADLSARVVVTSFDAEPIQALRDLAPALRRGLILGLPVADLLGAARAVGAQVVSVERRILSAELVRAMRENGIAVHAWTINAPQDLDGAFRLGLDAVVTDEPERALAIRTKWDKLS